MLFFVKGVFFKLDNEDKPIIEITSKLRSSYIYSLFLLIFSVEYGGAPHPKRVLKKEL